MSRAPLLLQPRWLALHLLTVALIVAMILLGRWQLTVSEHKDFSLRNFGYALQWWLFSGFVAFMWVRIARDGLQRAEELPLRPAEPAARSPEPVEYRRYVLPNSSDAPPDDDPERAAYNDYLARLARQAEHGKPRPAAPAEGHGEGTDR